MISKSTQFFLFICLFFTISSFGQVPKREIEARKDAKPFKFSGFVGKPSIGKPGDPTVAVLVSSIPENELIEHCTFFKGDTLGGFDFKEVSEHLKSDGYKTMLEFERMMFRSQVNFVKNKYNIKELPFEKAANAKKYEPPVTLASACSNLDFEDGNFTNWTISSGYNTNSNGNLTIGGAGFSAVNQNIYDCNDVQLISAAYPLANDPVIGTTGLNPTGGSFSARLGGFNINVSDGYGFGCPSAYYWNWGQWSNGEVLEQTFLVGASNALLSYDYAVVLNDGGHPNGQQPYFHIYVKNASTGAVLSSCTQYYVQATAGLPPAGFNNSGYVNTFDGSVLYNKGWTSNSINLSAYIGQTVNVEFVSAGCTAGAHMGWAYVDVTCGPANIDVSNTSPCIGSTTTLTAPAIQGGTYAWFGPGIVGASNGQSINVNSSGTYTVTVTPSQGASCAYNLTQAVTFNAAPSMTSTNTSTICSGGTVNIPLTSTLASSYTWIAANNANTTGESTSTQFTSTLNNTITNLSSSASQAVVYTVTPTSLAGGCVGPVQTVTVTVNPSPVVTSSNSQTICSGGSVNIPLTASTGSNFTWIANDNSNTSGESTTTQSTSTINNTITNSSTSAQTVIYTVTPTSSLGCAGTAQTVTVTINPSPTMTSTSAPSAICSGGTVNLPLTSTVPSNYTWIAGNNPNTSGESTTIQTTSTINNTITNSTSSPEQVTYTVTPTSNPGGCPGTSQTVTVTVNPSPLVSISSGSPQTVCAGSTVAALNFGSTPAGATFTWTNNNTTIGLSASGSGNISSFTSSNVSSTQTATITVNASLSGCSSSAPATATITVNPSPVVSVTSGSNQTVCGGATVSPINFSSNPAGATYTWTNNNTGIGLGSNGSGSIGSFTSSNVTSQQTATITINASLSGCGSLSPATATVTVNPTPTLSISSGGNQSVCGGSSISGVNFTSVPAGASFSWTNNNTSIGLGASGSGNISSFVAANVSSVQTATVTINASLSGCPSTSSANTTFTVNPSPTISVTSGSNQTICGGANVNAINFSSNPVGATFNWTNNNTNIGLPASGSGNIGSFVSSSVTSTQTATITVNANLSGCGSTAPATATITINPTPSVSVTSGSNQTVCGGSSVSAINFSSNPAGATYSWTNNNTNIGLGASGSGNIGSFVSSNVSTTQTATITINASLSGCGSTSPASAIVIVNPTPQFSVIPSSPSPVCSGGTINAINFSSNPAGATFNWTNNNTNIGLGASGSGNIAGYTAPSVASTQTGIVTITPSLGSCNGTPQNISITINALPVINTSSIVISPSNCSASTGSITGITASGAPVLSYSWNGGASQPNANITNVPAGTYNLVVTDGNGCQSNVGPYSITNPSAPSAPTVLSSIAVCEGSNVSFSIQSPVGGTTYTWTGPSGALGTGTTINLTGVTVANTGAYSATATQAGCTGGAGSATLTVNPNPIATITANNTSFCPGSTALLSASSSNPGGSATITGYQWFLNGSPISGAVSSTYNATTGGNYSVVVTNSNTCSDPSGNTLINVFTSPALDTTNATFNSTNCTTPTGSITGINITGTSPYTYQWFNSGGSLISTSTTTPDLNNISAGTYSLIATDANGCKDTVQGVLITNANAPNQPSANGSAYCLGDPINPITVFGTGGTYTWYSDAGLTNVLSTSNPYTPNNTVTDTIYVTETIAGCESSANPVIITIKPLPLAPTANGASYCFGQTVAALTSSAGANTNWYSNSGLTSLAGSGSPFNSGITSTDTLYAVEVLNGCEGPATQVIITINSLPIITTSAIVVDSASCGSSDGSITNVVVNGNPNFTYTWSNAGGTVSTSTTSPDLTNQASGSYTLSVTDVNGCQASQGPLVIDSHTNPPSPLFLTSNDTVHCLGDPIGTLTVQSNGGSVVWYDDQGLTNQIGSGLTYTPGALTATDTIYVVSVNNNCFSPVRPVIITISPLPVVSAGSSNVVTCQGTQLTLTASGNADVYSWSGGVIDGVPFTPGASGTYIVSGVDTLSGCTNSSSVNVTVNPVPSVVAGNDVSVCTGATVTLIGSGALTYSWSGGIIDGVPFQPSATTTYTLTGTDANGCVATDNVLVTVSNTPIVDAGLPAAIPCNQNNLVIVGTTNANNPTYNWSGPGITSAADSLQVTVNTAGTYYFNVIDGNGCSSTDSIIVTNDFVSAGFTPSTSSGFAPQLVNFTNTSVNASSYNWIFGDGNSSSATNPANTFNSVGTFTVTLIASNTSGCADTATAVINIEENSSIIIPNVFSPNGDNVNDFFFITSTGIQELNVDIFSRWGQKVYTITGPGQSWDGKLANGEFASEGTYFFLLRAKGFDGEEFDKQGNFMLLK